MTPTFLPDPTHYTLPEFRAYLAGLTLGAWRPRFPTLHNTGVPSLAQWLAYGPTPQARWGGNLNRYYQGLGWHAGPHLVVCPDYVWALCDLTKPGVSVSCWNSETFGIEMVGNYEAGGDDFAVGEGAKVRDNAAAILAMLASKFDWGDLSDIAIGVRGLHFHHDCARDHHSCPGSRVTKADMLARIAAASADKAAARPEAAAPSPASPPAAPSTRPPLATIEDIQTALNRLGADPRLAVDGDLGPATSAAVKTFQQIHRLTPDGWPGPVTCATLEAALASAGPQGP